MHFSLNGAATLFQLVMDKTLRGVEDSTIAYIDDILIYTPSWEAHLTHVCRVLHALRQIGEPQEKQTEIASRSVFGLPHWTWKNLGQP